MTQRKPRRTDAEIAVLVAESIYATDYRVTVVRELDKNGNNRSVVVGTCPAGHALRKEVRSWLQGTRCSKCDKRPVGAKRSNRHLVQAISEGYRAVLDMRSAREGGTRAAWLIGTCPQEHDFAMRATTFGRGQRCGACRLERASRDGMAVLHARGYVGVVTIQKRYTQNSVYFLGECPNGHAIRATLSALVNGHTGCHACAVVARGEESRRQVLEMATDEGYLVEVLLGRGSPTQRSSRVVGACPLGHRIDMLAANFRTGSRCATCAKTGFKVDAPAWFYVAVGRYARLPVLKFGITNAVPQRIKAHKSHGLALELSLRLGFVEGHRALALETLLKATLRCDVVPSCSERGLRFAGSTETFHLADLTVEEAFERIGGLLAEPCAPADGVQVA